MLEQAGFNIPFTFRLNPDRDGALERNLNWVRQFGLATDDESVERYRSSHVPDFASYIWPDAVGEDLDLGTDISAFFFLFDDLFDDSADGAFEKSLTLCQELIDLLFHYKGPVTAGANPFLSAFADIWGRETTGMSREWCHRAAYEWIKYFYSYSTEVSNHLTGAALSPEECLELRWRGRAGYVPTVDATERLGHFEVPLRALYSGHLRELLQVHIEHITLINDYNSLRKEERNGDQRDNVVHCMMRIRNISKQAAMSEVVRMGDERMQRFMELVEGVPQLCRALDLNEKERTAVERWIDWTVHFARAHYEWEVIAGRYSG
jgi:pentalenene synthase